MPVKPSDTLDGTAGTVDHYVRTIATSSESADDRFHRLESRLLRYDIFPPNLMRATVCSADGRVHEGTTIVQRVAIGPFTLESAVRVQAVWHLDDADNVETGFSYVTLAGHPERGVSSFRVARDGAGQIVFAIDARSQPGSLLTRVGSPFARRFQRRATEAALEYFASGQ